MEPESEVTISLEILSTNTNVPATAFSNLIATKTIKDTKTAAPFTYEQLGVPGKGIVEEVSEFKYTFIIIYLFFLCFFMS